jgi:hydroxyacylglutathione hydrolase
MLFERFEVADLAHYSYAVGCSGAGEAAIVDPERNTDRYLEWAAASDLRITRVLETHIHADFASGAKELAERAGAELLLSAYDEGELYDVEYEHRPVEHGETLEFGAVRLEAVHTPGHTPEHMSYLVYEMSRSEEVPEILLSGDFLFVGSLGRPDLLGEEAKVALAHRLYDSVRRKLASLPDGLEVAPAHGAGSMCGAGMSGRPTSTLGFERVANPYLNPDLSEQQFVEMILGNVPPFPPYYRRMKELNSVGPVPVAGTGPLPALNPPDFQAFIEAEDATVVDLRDITAYAGAHVPGSLGIGSSGNLTSWASWLVPYDRPILIVGEEESQVADARKRFYRVGLDQIKGYLSGGITAWNEAGLPVEELRQISARQLHDTVVAGETVRILDIRDEGEHASGHIPGAVQVHGGALAEGLDGVPNGGGPLVLVCERGYRSTAVSGVLRQRGFDNLMNLNGGMVGWRAAGLPVDWVRDEARRSAAGTA